MFISRIKAREQGLKRYFTGKPCINGHVCERFVSNKQCRECNIESKRLVRIRDGIEPYQAITEEDKKINIAKSKKRWKNNNRHIENSHEANRRAYKVKATPNWLTVDQKNDITLQYYISKEYELLTGMKYHVDHVIPLKHNNVCGLHVPWNLRVVRSEINLKKHNSFDGNW